MRTWTRLFGALAAAALIAGTAPAPALADGPASAANGDGHHGVAVITVVRARDLMSPADRQAYRKAMREAGSDEARQRVREATIERIQQRAAEHGVVMVIETRMVRPGERKSETRPDRPAPLPPRAP